MSASRMPVLRPIAWNPSARLTAVVDLPTPPLPEAIAMMCLTPGTPAMLRCPPACGWARGGGALAIAARAAGACLLHARVLEHVAAAWRCRGGRGGAALALGREHGHDTRDARKLGDDLLGGLAQRLELLGARGRHRDREIHAVVPERISDTRPRSTMLPSRSGPLTRRSSSRTCVFETDIRKAPRRTSRQALRACVVAVALDGCLGGRP